MDARSGRGFAWRLWCWLLSALAGLAGALREQRDVFTVAAVPVDATAANANAARDAGARRRRAPRLCDRCSTA